VYFVCADLYVCVCSLQGLDLQGNEDAAAGLGDDDDAALGEVDIHAHNGDGDHGDHGRPVHQDVYSPSTSRSGSHGDGGHEDDDVDGMPNWAAEDGDVVLAPVMTPYVALVG
jgi:hypothetical protein